jgi:hypothetical protein
VEELKDMEEFKACPHCGRSLEDPDLPDYELAVGVEIQGVYDGVLYWADLGEGGCGGAWNRWPDTEYWKRLHNTAQVYVDAQNERAGRMERK